MRKFFIVGLIAISSATLAKAAPTTTLECKGERQFIQFVRIKDGKLDLFVKAVADQDDWNAAHHIYERVLFGKIREINPEAKTASYSPMQAVRIVTRLDRPMVTIADAAWKVVDAEYKESSEILQSFDVCVVAPEAVGR